MAGHILPARHLAVAMWAPPHGVAKGDERVLASTDSPFGCAEDSATAESFGAHQVEDDRGTPCVACALLGQRTSPSGRKPAGCVDTLVFVASRVAKVSLLVRGKRLAASMSR